MHFCKLIKQLPHIYYEVMSFRGRGYFRTRLLTRIAVQFFIMDIRRYCWSFICCLPMFISGRSETCLLGQRAQHLQLSEEKCCVLERVKIVGILFVKPGARTEKKIHVMPERGGGQTEEKKHKERTKTFLLLNTKLQLL